MWRFYSPKIVFGKDSLEYLEKFENDSCVVVTDEVIKDLGYADILSRHLAKHELLTIRAEEPSIEDAKKLAEKMKEHRPKVIIALGGGSVIDAVKAGRILMETDIEPEEITPFTDLGEYGFKGESVLVAIPTTSGTGSEATWAIVLKDKKERRKVIMANEKVMPDIAVVDPVFVYSMPKNLVVYSGFDALSHAIEAFLSTFRNPFSDAFALDSTKMILDNFYESYLGNRDARERMHISATMAGIAFSNSQVGIVHALAHATGASLNIPHGMAVAIFLYSVLEFYRELEIDRLAELNLKVGYDILKEIERLESLYGIRKNILGSEIEKHKDEIINKAMEDSCIVTAPYIPEENDLEKIIERVVERCMLEEC